MISKACTIICTIECWTSKGKQYGLEFVQVKVNKTYMVEHEQFCVHIENQYVPLSHMLQMGTLD